MEKGTGMKTKKHMKNIIGAAITATALVAGSAGAGTLTGTVAGFFADGSGYTFVNISTPTGNGIAYYTGTNSAIATILDNARRHSSTITVTTDASSQITRVQ